MLAERCRECIHCFTPPRVFMLSVVVLNVAAPTKMKILMKRLKNCKVELKQQKRQIVASNHHTKISFHACTEHEYKHFKGVTYNCNKISLRGILH